MSPRPVRFARPAALAAALSALVAVVAVVTVVTAGGCSEPELPRPWPVLLITVDTLRPDYLSLNGYDRETTPRIDALLRSGFYFERALSVMGRTTPAIASLLTGTYPHTNGVRTLISTLRPEVFTLAQALRQAGYQTDAVLSNAQLSRKRLLHHGFDSYDRPHNFQDAESTNERARRALAELDPERPSFFWVHYLDPHLPYHPRAEDAERFDPGYAGLYPLRFGFEPGGGRPIREIESFPPDLTRSSVHFKNELGDDVNSHIARLYAGDIAKIDDPIADLVDTARQTMGENLIIIFTSDHGEAFGEQDYYFDHGDYTTSAELRVPLAIILPPMHPLYGSGRIRSWVSLVDVAPTLLELVGIRAEAALANQFEGRSLVAALSGQPLDPQPVFAETGRVQRLDELQGRVRKGIAGRQRAVYLDDWKLEWLPFQPEDRAWKLYDLSQDPSEIVNLYSPDRPEFTRLQDALRGWLEHARALDRSRKPSPAAEPSAEDTEALRALGYIE